MYSILIAGLCVAFTLVGRLGAYPLQKSDSKRPTWLDLFAPDGSIRQDVLETYPLYEYVYEDYEYGDQIWSNCGEWGKDLQSSLKH